MIRIIASTRTQSAPFEVAAYRRSVSGLLAAVTERAAEAARFRNGIDSDARLWIEIDGHRVDTGDIERAATVRDARAEAKALLS